MSEMNKFIKTCPFCAADVTEDHVIYTELDETCIGFFKVACSCGATGPMADRKDQAVKKWNERLGSNQTMRWDPFNTQIHMPDFSKRADFSGNLESIGPSAIIQILSSENKTGILFLTLGETKSAVCFKDGRIIAARGNKEQRLGEILLEKGLISHEKLHKALKIASKSQMRIGEVLLEMGYIKEETLKEIVSHQIRKAVSELFLWKEGSFTYRDYPVNFDEQIISQINTLEVILEASRRVDERAETVKI